MVCCVVTLSTYCFPVQAKEWKCQPDKFLTPENERHEILLGSLNMLIGSTASGVIACYIMNGGTIVYMHSTSSTVFYRTANFSFKLCNYCFFNLNAFLNLSVGRVSIGFTMVSSLNFRAF